MVKSKSFCFNIIACGSNSAEDDDLKPTEIKASTDKRGWSFRKRSPRHRVLSNTVTSEVLSSGHKDGPEAATTDINALINPMVPEKISLSQWKDEKIPSIPSDAVNSKLTNTSLVTEDASNHDYTVQESVAVVIQSAIRIYLAKKALHKLKNVVKLQAVVRGHLVRRQAVGTLRCVQAIVKMQALVRARRAHLSLEGLSIQEKHDGEIKTDKGRLNSLEYSGTETNASIKKLLANRFARQLLESKPKTKPIHIKCDPAKPDLAWNWLERWMSVSSSSSDIMQPQKSQVNLDHRENGTDSTAPDIGTEGPAEVVSESTDMKSGIEETEILIEGEENPNAYLADDFEFHAHKPKTVSGKTSSSALGDNLDGWLVMPKEMSTKLTKSLKDTVDAVSSQVDVQTSQTKHSTSSDSPELSNDHLNHSVKRAASEQIGNEGKKFTFGSRKSKNTAFVAAKSKFEELSTTVRSTSSGYHDAAVETRLDSPPSWTGSVSKDDDLSMTEDLISQEPRIQMWGSECGTELSITSTLDSPDIPEAEGVEIVHEIGSTDKELKNLDPEANNSSSMLENVDNSTYTGYVKPGKLQGVYGDTADSGSPVYAAKVHGPSEQIVSDVHSHVNTVPDQHLESFSPEGSPKSHITVTDCHGTPSSQISQTSMRNKSDKSLPSQKRPSLSAGKRSIPNQSHDSAVRNSKEHLLMDPKIGKKRNSVDHEPRATSSDSLPSYMQATESAKAKAYMNNSPKLSPDVHDKESHIKKRHSLPVTSGKQGSPRMQRSTSQAQQNVKGNATHSPQTATERKWQR